MNEIAQQIKEDYNKQESTVPVVINRKLKRAVKKVFRNDIPDFVNEVYTVRQFIKDMVEDTDCQPIGQRLPVDDIDDFTKSREIIESMFDGISIGQITLTRTASGEMYRFESVDGGHRKRAIRDFYRGRFKIFGKYTFKDLTKEQKEKFFNYKLSFCIYEPLTNILKGKIFRNINKTTDINFQEMLNSFGDTPIANAVRETVRAVTMNGIYTDKGIHELFKQNIAGTYLYTHKKNMRLVLEEFVARIYYRYYVDGFLGEMNDAKLIGMYEDDTLDNQKVKKLLKKVNAHLDFIVTMAKEKKALHTPATQLAWREMNCLSRMFFHFNRTMPGGFRYTSNGSSEFFKNWYSVYTDYTNDLKKKWTDIVVAKFEPKSGGVTIQQCFINYTTNCSDIRIQEQLMKWLFNEMDLNGCIIPLDPQRLFTKKVKDSRLAEQKYRCAIDNKPLTYEDAEAAHDLAYILGGATEYDNCAMVRKKHNRGMGFKHTIESYCDLEGFDGLK